MVGRDWRHLHTVPMPALRQVWPVARVNPTHRADPPLHRVGHRRRRVTVRHGRHVGVVAARRRAALATGPRCPAHPTPGG